MIKRVDWTCGFEDNKFYVSDSKGLLRTLADAFGTENQSLTISVGRSTRSNSQNRYLWGLVYRAISDHTGYTCEEVHEICKQKFLAHIIHVGDEDYNAPKSTAKLDKGEFSEYVDAIRNWAGTLDIQIPEAGEVI